MCRSREEECFLNLAFSAYFALSATPPPPPKGAAMLRRPDAIIRLENDNEKNNIE